MEEKEAVSMLQTMAEINHWVLSKGNFTDDEAADITVKLYKKGIKLKDLAKKEYKDLPLNWIVNMIT